MGATIQRLWRHISHLPFLSFLLGREAEARDHAEDDAPEPGNDAGAGWSTAKEIEASERGRAERFKRDQLLPIMGLVGPPI